MAEIEQKPRKTSDRAYYLFAIKIMGDFGATIAIPVVLFVLAGQYFDEKYNRQPLFTILAFVPAALISARLVYKKAKKYGEYYQKMN